MPDSCKSRYKVAIVVPYRGRETNLIVFLRNIHPFLQKQQIHYAIYIVEPLANLTFNRGLLMNIGFVESLKLSNDKWDCFMFHGIYTSRISINYFKLLYLPEDPVFSTPDKTWKQFFF
jgi:hypothetical protein